MNILTLVAGPLVVPECLRAARRPWVGILRVLAGVVLAAPAMIALWWLWVGAEVEPVFQGDLVIPVALMTTVGLSVAIAILLSPAVLAGSLAGDRERGSIGLLLSTRVDSREIVLGRLLGKLTPVFAMLLAGWPLTIMFGVLRDLDIFTLFGLLLLPFAVALGAGGLAIAMSSVAKRGWSALMTIYLAEVLLLLLPAVGLIPGWSGIGEALGVLNPFNAVSPAIALASAWPLAAPIATWLTLGGLGSAFAAWRLRPAFLASVGGKAGGGTRTRTLPPVDEERPMLWKELYTDRGAVLGVFGKILGIVLFLYLAVGSLALAGIAAYFMFVRRDVETVDRITNLMGHLYADPGTLYSCFLQIAVGLRASVAIASEREQGTWEALLTSPLTGKEILWGKLRGSLHSLRWLFAATVLAWVICLVFGAMRGFEFAALVAQILIGGTFAAAVGVRASLACGTATRAMSTTVGSWLAALLAISALAAISALGLLLMGLMAWMIAGPLGLVAPGRPPWGFGGGGAFGTIWAILMASMYVSFTSTLVAESWARFDSISGRMAGDGRDGKALAPVFEDGTPANAPKTASIAATT